tara:strand:+ start:185 stop:763 length:579 start_codon:yes stop_codon:yes gene_type:complete
MSLWGTTDGTKPKFLTDEEKKLVFANQSGWVLEAGAESAKFTGNDNPNAQPEVLVAIGNLADSIGAATITEIEFMTTAFSKAAGGTISMRVRYNEEVTVTGVPRFVINNTTNASRHQTCTYVSGSGTNELIFGKTLGANSGDINASDVLNVIANPIAHNGGSTIKDKGTSTNAEITSSTAIGTAAGTLTIAA